MSPRRISLPNNSWIGQVISLFPGQVTKKEDLILRTVLDFKVYYLTNTLVRCIMCMSVLLI